MDLEKIYQEYFTTVYRYILAISRDPALAEEVTQETFVKALRKISDFRGDCEIRVWLCQIAKNEYFQYLRKSKRHSVTATDIDKKVEGPELQLVAKETSFRIQKILHEMEEPYKEVFYMRTYGEMSFRDIGELFGKQETWARVTYYRARKKIMEVLQNEDNL